MSKDNCKGNCRNCTCEEEVYEITLEEEQGDFTEIYFRENFLGEETEFMIKKPKGGMNVAEMIDYIIRPLMKAYGYYDVSIEKYVSEDTWENHSGN